MLERSAQSEVWQGIGLRILAIFLATTMAVLVRRLAQDVPTGQIVFWRSFMSLPPILFYMALRSELPSALKTARPMWHVFRGAVGVVAMFLSFYALKYLPIANQTALTMLAPIMSLPLAALILKERVGPVLIAACVLGFLGALAILYSAMENPSDGAIKGVMAALTFAFLMAGTRILVRTMTKTERPSTLAFYFALAGSVAFLPWSFATPVSGDFLWAFCGVGLLGALVHITATEAIARAEVSAIAPFEFTMVIFALGYDVLLFSIIPSGLDWLGIMAIAAAGTLVALRR